MTEKHDSQRHAWVLGFLEEYEGRLVRYAARMLGEEDSARDVVQYTFMRLCEHPPDETKQRTVQWLFTVCRNKAVDVLRKERKNVQLDDDAAWQGTVRYNLACHYALAGRTEEAIARLGEALVLNPGLHEWSLQDTDLDSLRQEPGYLALYEQNAS